MRRARIPTRQWLYNMCEDNAHKGQNWCKNGKANGSYVQQIEYDDCQSGWVWEPGQAVIAAIGQGYVTSTPLQLTNAYTALADGGTLYSPRIGEALVSASGKLVQKINPPVIRHLPVSSETLAYMRSALAGVVTQGTAAGRVRRVPARPGLRGGQDRYRAVMGKNATSVFASFAPCKNPKFVVVVMLPNSGYGADAAAPAVRQIWDGIYGLEGNKAAMPGGNLPGCPDGDCAIARASGEGDGRSDERRASVTRLGRAAGRDVRAPAPVAARAGVRQGRRGPVLGLAADPRHLRAGGARHGARLGGDRAVAAPGRPRPAHVPEEGGPVGACSGSILMFVTA